jgi:hypothetical protein
MTNPLDPNHKDIFNTTKASITVAEMKIEQNYKPIDRAEFDQIIKNLSIEESIEVLLSMLNK